MLAALGFQPPADAAVARLLALAKDPRGWQDATALVLSVVPPNTPLRGLHDKKSALRILETVLVLCEGQLLPFPSVDATAQLLKATARLLATRQIYAHVPKCELGFFATAARELLSTARDGTSPGLAPAVAWDLLAELIGIVEAMVESLPGANSEDARLAAQNRTHAEASGLIALIFDVCAAASGARRAHAPRAVDLVITRCLRVMHALLSAPGNTGEYSVTLSCVQLAVQRCDTLLRLCRHDDDDLRGCACAVLQAVLLEAECATASRTQAPSSATVGPALPSVVPACAVPACAVAACAGEPVRVTIDRCLRPFAQARAVPTLATVCARPYALPHAI
jgi:hypothetical protein